MRTDFVQAGTVKLQYFEHGTGPERSCWSTATGLPAVSGA